MKKLLLSFVFMMMGALFFILPASADSSVNFHIEPQQTITVYLSQGRSFSNVTGHGGDFFWYDWRISGQHTPTLKYSAVSVDVSANSPDLDLASSCVNNSGRVYGYFNFDSYYTNFDATVSVAVSIYNSSTTESFNSSVTLNCGSATFVNADRPTLSSLNAKIDQILSVLGAAPAGSDFLGANAMVYFREEYFPTVSSSSGSVSFSDGLPILTSASDIRLSTNGQNSAVADLYFDSGLYYLVYSVYGNNHHFSNIKIAGSVEGTNFSVGDPVFQNSETGISLCVVPLTVKMPIVTNAVRITLDSVTTGVFYGGIVRASLDDQASSVITDEFGDKVDEVDNAGQQQAQQEEDTWNNINSYKGDLDFSIDWSAAASGLSYVSGIFMMIWDNSPTEIITLSLMLGIAMLGIGRGVQAAVRVSRNSSRKGGDGDA